MVVMGKWACCVLGESPFLRGWGMWGEQGAGGRLARPQEGSDEIPDRPVETQKTPSLLIIRPALKRGRKVGQGEEEETGYLPPGTTVLPTEAA